MKGVSNDVVICCLIVGIAEGNLGRHYMHTHKNAAEEIEVGQSCRETEERKI